MAVLVDSQVRDVGRIRTAPQSRERRQEFREPISRDIKNGKTVSRQAPPLQSVTRLICGPERGVSVCHDPPQERPIDPRLDCTILGAERKIDLPVCTDAVEGPAEAVEGAERSC